MRSHQHTHLILMLTLTFSTGVVDAVGFLGLDKVFVGNMTGNVVILGMGMVGADDLPVAGPALALVGFMLGAAVAGRVLRRNTQQTWAGSTTAVLGVVAALIVAAAVGVHRADSLSHLGMIAVTTSLATGMGMQAAAARVIAVKDVTTVVVTSSITGLAADSWFGARLPGSAGRRVAAVLALLVGAAVGAASLGVDPALGLYISATAVFCVVLFGGVRVDSDAIKVSDVQRS